MERDDIRAQLRIVRRRHEQAVHAEADLARRQRVLESRLTVSKRDPSGGSARSPADLVGAIRAWRRNIRSVESLSPQVREARDHLRGDPAAALVVVEYGDYQCMECAAAHRLHARVKPWLDGGRLAVVFRHFPLVDAHPLALRAAEAAEAAAAQGRFWEMHDVLMEDVSEQGYHERTPADAPSHEHEHELERAARRAGLDLARFRRDLADAAPLDHILEDFRSGLASGVNGTPTFFVNGLRADIGGVEELYELIAASPAVAWRRTERCSG